MSGLLPETLPTGAFLAVYVAFHLKHYTADYLLQTCWMVDGKARADRWLLPLAAHAGVHGLLTTAIALTLAPTLAWLGLVDLVIHATVDRSKVLLAGRRGWTPAEPQFWWAFGLDQEAHALTHLVLALAIVIGAG